jgi:hypothetical protein
MTCSISKATAILTQLNSVSRTLKDKLEALVSTQRVGVESEADRLHAD